MQTKDADLISHEFDRLGISSKQEPYGLEVGIPNIVTAVRLVTIYGARTADRVFLPYVICNAEKVLGYFKTLEAISLESAWQAVYEFEI